MWKKHLLVTKENIPGSRKPTETRGILRSS